MKTELIALRMKKVNQTIFNIIVAVAIVAAIIGFIIASVF